MKPGRSALGVMAGVLLGLGVVALAGPGLNLYGTESSATTPNSPSVAYTSLQSATTASTTGTRMPFSGSGTTSPTTTGQNSTIARGVANASLGFYADIASVSQVNSIARQSISLTGFAFIPVLAALLFGFVLYRVSKARNEEEHLPEPA